MRLKDERLTRWVGPSSGTPGASRSLRYEDVNRETVTRPESAQCASRVLPWRRSGSFDGRKCGSHRRRWFWMRGDVAGTTRAAAPPGSRRYAELSTYTREARGHHRDGPQMSLSDCPGCCRTSPPAVLWSVHLRSTERRPNALTVKGEGWGTRVPHGVSCTQTFLPSHRRAGPLAGGWAQPGHWDAARPDSTVPGSEGPTWPSGPVRGPPGPAAL